VAIAEAAAARDRSSIGANHARFEGLEERLEVWYAGGDERQGYDDFTHEDQLPEVECRVVVGSSARESALEVVNLHYGDCHGAARRVSSGARFKAASGVLDEDLQDSSGEAADDDCFSLCLHLKL